MSGLGIRLKKYLSRIRRRLWRAPCTASTGSAFTIFTVSTLTCTTWRMRRRMYSGSSSRLGSLVMPLRLSVETWY